MSQPLRDWTGYDQVGAIIEYETEGLNDADTVKLFQNLVDTGNAWTLQGHYGRTATNLIEAGYVSRHADKAPIKTV